MARINNIEMWFNFVMGGIYVVQFCIKVLIPKISLCYRVLVYNFSNLENPTTSLLGTLVKAGVRVLAYR
jgi:hypothetical protein